MGRIVEQTRIVSRDSINPHQIVSEVAFFDADGLPVNFGSGAAPVASPTFTGNPKAPTPAVGDNDTSIATTAFVLSNAGKNKTEIAALTAVSAANAAAAADSTPTKAEYDVLVTLANANKVAINALIVALKA